ncbi:hypothetical protein [Thermoflavimicrobium daqui]|jgi:hypothetical protein|uniref:Integrase catalytic domain-containing protein n=1 Tax=Thermoflavimicrobium daqui TaxID=2137476 RepID=A0A364K7I2_9BACL|nr:hypothetical protein [Thermoflavimicrobium daqui]RAL26247.1 hypothetical protein DL897_04425 [Thermoflavimicrobium daqui]
MEKKNDLLISHISHLEIGHFIFPPPLMRLIVKLSAIRLVLPDLSLMLETLEEACSKHHVNTTILHSDQGRTYTARMFQEVARKKRHYH